MKLRWFFVGAILLNHSTVWAGPPFLTDDPDPVEYQNWEVNYALTGTRVRAESTADVPQIDVNYGVLPGVQLHVMPQMGYRATPGQNTYGLGNTELGVKYRLTSESSAPEDWMVAVYPLYELSSGNPLRFQGTGASSTYLPVWVQTQRGKWTVYGGGGYWINPGASRKNAWAAGWVTLYQWTPQLQLGGEVFAQTDSMSSGESPAYGFNLGGTYALSTAYALLFSVGQGLTHVASTNQGSYYLGLQKLY